MEMALNMGAFEALDQQEMFEVDGGADWGLIIAGAVIFAAVAVSIAVMPLSAPIALECAWYLGGSLLSGTSIGIGIMK